jgi:hypothetical protein
MYHTLSPLVFAKAAFFHLNFSTPGLLIFIHQVWLMPCLLWEACLDHTEWMSGLTLFVFQLCFLGHPHSYLSAAVWLSDLHVGSFMRMGGGGGHISPIPSTASHTLLNICWIKGWKINVVVYFKKQNDINGDHFDIFFFEHCFITLGYTSSYINI